MTSTTEDIKGARERNKKNENLWGEHQKGGGTHTVKLYKGNSIQNIQNTIHFKGDKMTEIKKKISYRSTEHKKTHSPCPSANSLCHIFG